MKLTDFYQMDESHTVFYTIEPDGRLLEWDQASYEDGDSDEIVEDTSFYVVAEGGIDTLIEELDRRVKLTSEDIGRIEFNASMGCTVTIVNEGGKVTVRL